ncbi:MAG: ATP-dependent dethiobiotin synthetase BioD, partial [Thermodesulfobacteriota bacterium]
MIDFSPGHKKDGAVVLFITGTDTSVGKTLICSLLLGFFLDRDFKAICQKWVSTGGENPDDFFYIFQNNNLDPGETPLDILAPYCFSPAVSPHLAAEEAGRPIDPEVIKKCLAQARANSEVLLVEG